MLAERRKCIPCVDKNPKALAVDNGVFQASERPGIVTETSLDLREFEGRHVGRQPHAFELEPDGLRLFLLSPSSVHKSQRPEQPGAKSSTRTELQTLLQRIFGCLEVAAPCVRQSEEPIRSVEVGLERECPPTVHGSSVEAFIKRMNESEVSNDRGRQRVQFDGLLERIDRLREPATGRLPEHTKPVESGRIAGIE